MIHLSTITRRFLAGLTILSVTFTQACPAWALRNMGADNPAVPVAIKAGLEEQPSAGNVLLTAPPDSPYSVPASFPRSPAWAVASPEVERVRSLLTPYARQYARLGEGFQNVPAFIRYILEDLRKRKAAAAGQVPFALPTAEEVDLALGELERNGPTPGCACWLRAGIHYFGDPQRTFPEPRQGEAFNAWEQLLAVSLAAEWLLTGKVNLAKNPSDGDVTPELSLAALQAGVSAVTDAFSSNFPWLVRKGMDVGQLAQALKQEHGVLAYVGGDHVVYVQEVTATHVVYRDDLDGKSQRKTHDSFLKWWNQGPVPGVALTTAAPATAAGLLSFEQARQMSCGCGAYLNTVRSGGIAAALLALMKFEYRGRDNAGLLWVDEHGARRWTSIGPGAVRNLVRHIYLSGDVQEAFAFGMDPFALKNARRRVIELEGLDGLLDLEDAAKHRDLEGVKVSRIFLADEEGNPIPQDQRVHLTLGDLGSMHAGRRYSIDDNMEVIETISQDYGIHPDIVKMFVRFELEKIIGGKADDLLVRAFDQLVDRAREGELNPKFQLEVAPGRWLDEAAAWKEILKKFHSKKERVVTVPAVFNQDIVRQVFRMHGAVIGSFSVHPEWKREIEAIFNRRMAQVNEGRVLPLDWFLRWQEEKAANIVGEALEAFNEWMHLHFYRMGRIHKEVWGGEGFEAAYSKISLRHTKPDPETRLQYESDDRLMGRFDGFLAELMGETVLGHGRWGMSGGIFIELTDASTGQVVRDSAPAHPHSDPEGVHWVTHNGQINAEVYKKIREEHERHGVGYLSKERNLPIGTDTRAISNHWYYLVQIFRGFYDAWKRNPSVQTLRDRYGLSPEDADLYDKRFKKWGDIAATQLHAQGLPVGEAEDLIRQSASWDEITRRAVEKGLVPPWSDEIAHRLSSLELAQKNTQMGVTTYSLHDPFTSRAVSHNRELAVNVWNQMATISSDDTAGLSLYPPRFADQASRKIREIKERTLRQINDLEKTGLPPLEFLLQALVIYKASEDEITNIKAPFSQTVYYLRKEDNYVKVWREIDREGKPVQRVEVTTLDGRPKEVRAEFKIISPEVADKGPYSTYTEAHFREVPWAVLKLVLNYMSVKGASSLADVQPSVGSDPATREPQSSGVHWEFLEKQFGGPTLPKLRRIILGGVGSAEINVLIAAMFGEDVLPPGVDLVPVDTASFSDMAASNAMEMNAADLFIANTQSGTTASTIDTLDHAEAHGVTVIANTGNISKTIPDRAQQTGGALDILAGQEVTTAAYMAFLAQNITLILLLLEMAKRMGVPQERLDPYVRDILRLPKLLKEETDSQEYRQMADRMAQANKDHNKALVIASASNPFFEEVALKDRETVWRPVRPLDYRDDIMGPLQAADRDKKTTVYIWATDPDRLDEALAVVQLAKSLGLEPVVVTVQEGNSHLSELRQTVPFLFEVPRLTGALQAIADNPVVMQLIWALMRAKGRTDEEIDFLRNLAKSVTVFSGGYKVKKFVQEPNQFELWWQERKAAEETIPWRTYLEWRESVRAQPGDEGVPQLEAIAELPLLLREMGKELVNANGVLRVGISSALRGKFGPNMAKLKKIVIVTDQEPLRYAAKEAQLVYAELLGFQVNQVKVVSPHDPSAGRYIDPENTLVVALSQSQRDFSDRRLSSRGPVMKAPDFQNEEAVVSFAQRYHDAGVSVVTISDAASGLINVGKAGFGNIVLPQVGDTAVKAMVDLCLDSLGIQIGKNRFESGAPRRNLDDRIKMLHAMPEFLSYLLSGSALQQEVRQAAGVVARYDKHILVGGAQAEQGASETSRTMGNLGQFGEKERAHSMAHGPLTAAENEPSKFVIGPDGAVAIRDSYATETDTHWVLFINGNDQIAQDDTRNITTRSGVVTAVVPEHLAGSFASAIPNQEGSKTIDVMRVINVPDVPPMMMKYLNHVVGNLLAYELSRHHSFRNQVEAKLSGMFKPFVDQVTEMISTFEATNQRPQYVSLPDLSNPNQAFLLLIGADRLGLNRDVAGVLASGGVNILDGFPTNIAGYGGVILFHVSYTEEALPQLESLRPRIMEALAPPAESQAQQFRQALLEELQGLHLSIAQQEPLVRDAEQLFQAFDSSGRPQVQAFSHPSGDPGKSIVIALDADRQGLLDDVLIPISREAEANLITTEGRKVGDASFFVLDVEDRGFNQIRPVAERLRMRLEGLRMTPAFEQQMRPLSDRMPNVSLYSLSGAKVGLRDPSQLNYVVPSLNVPDSNTQTAITLVVRNDPAVDLNAQLVASIAKNGLQVVPNPAGEPMLVDTVYQEEGDPVPVRILRVVVDAPIDQESIKRIVAEMKAVVNPRPLPQPLAAVELQVTDMIAKFQRDSRVAYRAFDGPQAGQTTLVIVGEKTQPGLLVGLITPLGVRFNVPEHGSYDADGAGLDWAVVQASMKELYEAGVLREIGRKLQGIQISNLWALMRLTEEELDSLHIVHSAFLDSGEIQVRVEPDVFHPETAAVITIVVPEGLDAAQVKEIIESALTERGLPKTGPDVDALGVEVNSARIFRYVSNRDPEDLAFTGASERIKQQLTELQAGLEETPSRDPLDVLLGYKYLTAPPSYASVQDPRQYWLDVMRGRGIRDVSTPQSFFVGQVPFGTLELPEQQRLVDLINQPSGLEENAPKLERQRDGSFKVTEPGVLVGTADQPFIDLANGAHLAVEAGDSRIELAEGVIIEPNAVLVAPQGQTITIGAGTRILTNAQIWGDVAIGTNSQIAGTLTGKTTIADAVVMERGAHPTINDSVIGNGTKFTRGSNTVVDNSMLLPRRIRTRGSDGQVAETMQPVLIKQATAIENSVIWGSPAFQDSVIVNSVMDLGLAGNHVMISRSSIKGVSPSSRTAAAHYNYLISLFSVPLAERRDLTQPDQRELLRRELAALRFGVVEERKAETLIPNDAHASRPVENLTLSLGSRTIQVRAKSSNIGAAAGTSNFDPRFEVKAPTLLWSIWAGVNAVFAGPVEVGPLSGVASQAQVKGIDALEPGTLVFPGGGAGGSKSGELIKKEGRLGKGVETNVDIRLQVIRLLEIETQVALDGLAYETEPILRAGLIREAKQYQAYVKEAREDLERYLEIVGVSVGNLTADQANQQPDDKLQEQQRVLARKQAYLDVAKEAAENVERALEQAEKLPVVEHTMANIVEFRLPKEGIVRIERGGPGLSNARAQEGLRRVRGENSRRKPLPIIFAAGAFSRFVDSVTAESPFFAQTARDRGLANSEGNPSKLTAPMGVSGLGPILRILEGWADLGRRAGEPIDVVIIDSAGNRDMLLRAINADRNSANPRIPWQFLNILPSGIPVDQGEGLQALVDDGTGQRVPLFEYNPETGRTDKPVMRPSGEFGALYAGVQAARAAGIKIVERDVVPIYGDQSMMYNDTDFLAAVLAQAGEADITGINTDHRETGGRWVPSGGVWTEAQWPDGTAALVIAERNVRDPNAAGVYNARLDSDERRVITASANQTGFPYNAAAPIFSGPFVEAEVQPDKISIRLSTKTIEIKTGPNPGDVRRVDVFLREMEMTEFVQKGTQHAAGQLAPYRGQMIVTGNWRYQGIKARENLQPGNDEIYNQSFSLFTRLGGRSADAAENVEVAPGAGAFLGDGEILVTEPDQVGLVQDRRGLWLHRKIAPPAGSSAPDLFTEGRLLIVADSNGNIPLAVDMGISPATYDDLPAQTGLEKLTLDQIRERLQPLRDFFTQAQVQPAVLALDVDGVTTAQDGVLSDETRGALDRFIGGIPKKAGLLLLTDISPGQLRDRVEGKLTPATLAKTVSFPLSGGEFVGHVISDNSVVVLDRFVQELGGKGTVLRMDAKQQEYADEQISEESLEHGFDINRGSDGQIVGIDIELNKDWLKTQITDGQDPRTGWVDRLQKDLRDANMDEAILQNLHPAGSGSLTWVPAKGRALIRWAAQQGINPNQTVFVDDSAVHFAEFPDAARWGGALVYIGKYDPSLPANVIQIGRLGEGKPANGPEIAREVIRQLTAGLEEPLDTLIPLLPPVQAISALQNPQAYWIERMSARRISDLGRLQAFLNEQRVPAESLAPADLQSLLNLVDNYNALMQIFTDAAPKGLGLDRQQAVNLIQSQADAGGTTFAQQVRGVLDVPDSELPSVDAFDRVLRSAGALIFSGGNSGRAHFEMARKGSVVLVSFVPPDDDGGNYGEVRKLAGRVTMTGDTGNQRTNNASLFIRQVMADRTPEKPKAADEKAKWESQETLRSLLLQAVATALQSFEKQAQSKDPAVTTADVARQILEEPSLVRSLATFISAHRIVSQRFPELLKTKVPSKASGQNILGLAITLRSGLYDATTPEAKAEALKRASLLWNQALGLSDSDGLVVPASLDLVRLYFVYDSVTNFSNADDIAKQDLLTVTLDGDQLVLNDAAGRKLIYDAAAGAYVGRNDDGENRFEAFPPRMEQLIRERVGEVGAVSIVRGEDFASEEDTLYEGSQVIAWGAEFKRGQEPHSSPAAQEMYQAVLHGEVPNLKVIPVSPGSEGTSIAPHFWRREMVEFLQELGQRRAAGQTVPRVVFTFNPAETNDSFGLGIPGQIRNHERIFREVLNDPSVRFEDLISEVVVFDHTDPWVTAPNPAVAKEMGVSLADVDYARLLGPSAEEKQAGKRHGLVKKNRQATPAPPEVLSDLRDRFGADKVWNVPAADVRGTVESSRGKISRSPRVLALTHRLGLILYPAQRSTLLPEAVREETRVYQEKHEGQAPTPDQLAEFLNKFGAKTTADEVRPLMSGLEEATVATTWVSWTPPDTDRLLGEETVGVGEQGILPESDTAVPAGLKIIAGPHVTGLALGAAASTLTTPDGKSAAQVIFVVENDAEADLVNRLASPLMVFSASEYGGSLKAALSAARDFLRGARELGTDNQPVPQTVVQMLRNLFGIELAPDSIAIWNSFIERVTGALSAQA